MTVTLAIEDIAQKFEEDQSFDINSSITLVYIVESLRLDHLFCLQVLWFMFGSSRKVQFIEAGEKDRVTSRLELLTDKMRSQHSRSVISDYEVHITTAWQVELVCLSCKSQVLIGT